MNMGAFPSGQWGQTVNLLLNASVVRIHQLPPKRDTCKGVSFFVLYNFYGGIAGGFEQPGPRVTRPAGQKQSCGLFLGRGLANPPAPTKARYLKMYLAYFISNIVLTSSPFSREYPLFPLNKNKMQGTRFDPIRRAPCIFITGKIPLQ